MLRRPLSLLFLLVLVVPQLARALENILQESAADLHDLKEADPQQDHPLDEPALQQQQEQEEGKLEQDDIERDDFGDDDVVERAAFMSQFAADPLVVESPDDSTESQQGIEAQHEDHPPKRKLTEAMTAPTLEEDDLDEFAALADIDLSPFHMHFADKAVLARLVDWAYDRTAYRSRFHDGFVHAEELGSLFGLALNPTGADVPAEYQGLLEAAAADMRATQGLLEGETPVPRGFVGRGMPLRTLQELAQQMHALHSEDRRRRLEEL